MDIPLTRYVRSGEVHIAYQVVGSGPIDLVYIPGWVSNIEQSWQMPDIAAWLHQLASFSRLILFDKRGTGLSDRVQEQALPDLATRIDDMLAVMEHCHCRRAALLGVSEGAPMAIAFAAHYPDRVSRLLLFGGYVRWIATDDFPWGLTREQHEKVIRRIEQQWGEAVGIELMAPGIAADQQARAHWAAFLRHSASPGAAACLYRMNMEIDVRSELPRITVPTLIMHRHDDRLIGKEHGRFLHAHIAGSAYLELDGDDHLPFFGKTAPVLRTIQTFLPEGRLLAPPPKTLPQKSDLTTLLKIKDYLHLAYREPITIRNLARRFAVNEFKLKNGFKALFGQPVIAYLSELRLEAACQLLRDTDLSIETISEQIGYQHANNFSAAFKKVYGRSPFSWRKEFREKES